jgi:hypothetical protein
MMIPKMRRACCCESLLIHVLFCHSIFRKSFATRFEKALSLMSFTTFQREVIKSRFVSRVLDVEHAHMKTAFIYTCFNLFTTIAGVLVTGFITLEKISLVDSTTATVFFWLGWSLSLIILIVNKMMSGFNIYQRYAANKTQLDQYYSEGWMFIEGINIYAHCPNNSARFSAFCERVEQITRTPPETRSEHAHIGGGDNTEDTTPVDVRISKNSVPDIEV